MSGYVGVNIDGMAELKKNLNSLGLDMRLKAGERATRAGAALIRKEAAKQVPVDTGDLKNSLTVMKLSRKGDGRPTFAVTHKKNKKSRSGGWYAHLVEFGAASHRLAPRRKKAMAGWTGRRLGRSGGHEWAVFGMGHAHPGARAKPYLRPAFYDNAERSIEEIRKRLRRFIEKGK